MRNPLRRGVVACVLFALLVASATGAQPTPELLPPDTSAELAGRFRGADLDRSGALTRAEASGGGFAIEERFDAIDRDGSGTVTLVEIGGYVASATREWLTGVRAADVDRDGRVSEQEAAGAPSIASVFKVADRNQDNLLSPEEYQAFSETQLYRSVDLPSVAPNIIEKKF